MLRPLFHQATHNFRYFAPPLLTTLAYMVYRFRGAYLQDGLLTVHNSDFRHDPKFRKAYRRGKATAS
jgi:hypothetical protein